LAPTRKLLYQATGGYGKENLLILINPCRVDESKQLVEHILRIAT
jgi:hypothetical protein